MITASVLLLLGGLMAWRAGESPLWSPLALLILLLTPVFLLPGNHSQTKARADAQREERRLQNR